jgi:hypothetical protein
MPTLDLTPPVLTVPSHVIAYENARRGRRDCRVQRHGRGCSRRHGGGDVRAAAGRTSAACGQLEAFINMVKVQAHGPLTQTAAQSLIQVATEARAALGCR